MNALPIVLWKESAVEHIFMHANIRPALPKSAAKVITNEISIRYIFYCVLPNSSALIFL